LASVGADTCRAVLSIQAALSDVAAVVTNSPAIDVRFVAISETVAAARHLANMVDAASTLAVLPQKTILAGGTGRADPAAINARFLCALPAIDTDAGRRLADID